MKEANKAILREKHQMPTVEEQIHDLNGEKVFSKLTVALNDIPAILLFDSIGESSDSDSDEEHKANFGPHNIMPIFKSHING